MVNKTAWISGVVLLVVTLLVVFQVLSNTSPEIINSADSITDANNCSEGSDSTGAEYTYNTSSGVCYNSSGDAKYTAGQYDLPLNSLFSSNGVALLVFMGAVLLLLVVLSLTALKKKFK